MWTRGLACRVVAAMALLPIAPGVAGAQSTVELPGSVVQLPRHPAIKVESIDVQLGLDAVRMTYVLRNTARAAIAFVAAITLPDLDMPSLSGEEVRLPRPGDSNFVNLTVAVDGQAIVPALEQRAMALGLDVTRMLFDNGIPLFPFVAGIGDRLAGLAAESRALLLERGVVTSEGGTSTPGWALKSTLHWRMQLPPGATTMIAASYRPIPSTRAFARGDAERFASTYCASSALQQALQKRLAGGQAPSQLATLALGVPSGAGQMGPAGHLRITIVLPDELALASSCWPGFRRSGPLTLEWTGTDAVLDDDIVVAFIQ